MQYLFWSKACDCVHSLLAVHYIEVWHSNQKLLRWNYNSSPWIFSIGVENLNYCQIVNLFLVGGGLLGVPLLNVFFDVCYRLRGFLFLKKFEVFCMDHLHGWILGSV